MKTQCETHTSLAECETEIERLRAELDRTRRMVTVSNTSILGAKELRTQLSAANALLKAVEDALENEGAWLVLQIRIRCHLAGQTASPCPACARGNGGLFDDNACRHQLRELNLRAVTTDEQRVLDAAVDWEATGGVFGAERLMSAVQQLALRKGSK